MIKFLKTTVIALSGATLTTSALADVPADSAYRTDPQFAYNKDYTAEALKVISIVSCYIKGMAPEVAYGKVGTTPYVAMVDQNKCESDKKVTDSGSGSNAVSKNFATSVLQLNVDGAGVLTGKVWMTGKEEDGSVVKTLVSISITGGPAKKPPYGEWEVNWCDLDTAGTSCASKGFARVDASGMRAYTNDVGNGWNEERAVLGNIAADEKSGGGKFVYKQGNGNGVTRKDKSGYYEFAPNLMYSKLTNNMDNSSTEQCLIPNSTQSGTLISDWETWLYDATTGQRKDVNSGFQIKDSAGNWGWAGYWGVSFGNQVPGNNTSVSKVNKTGGVEASYTVFTTKGKLRKIDVSNNTLASIAGLPVKGWVPKAMLTGNSSDTNWVSATYMWDATNNEFVFSSYQTCTNSCTENVLGTPLRVSLDRLSGNPTVNTADYVANGLNQSNIGGWMEGANFNFNIILSKWELNNNNWSRTRYTNPSQVVVKTRKESIVKPDDTTVPSALYCVGQCVDNNNTARWEGQIAQGAVRQYTWDASTGTLKNGANNPIDFTSSSSNSFYSGVLVPQSALPQLACQTWDSANSQYVPGYCESNADAASNSTSYYRWESGPNIWSRYVGLKNSNNELVSFNPPMDVRYVVPSDDNSAGQFKGKTVSFQYPGGGNLWVPGFCFDPENRQRKNCDDSTEWANEFNIPYDLTKGVVTDSTGTNYLVKTLRRGVYFPQAANGACVGLQSTAQSYSSKTLPSSADWKNPSDPNSSGYIGPWQDPVGSPLIIDGVLQ
jgi:hypothetical protein